MNLPNYAMGDLVFLAYSLTSVLLCLNLLFLWVASGAVRAKGGLAVNPEDGARFNAPVSDQDPPAVARVLRAHRNAEAVIYPFLLLGLVYVLAGGTFTFAAPIFAIFVASRLAHSGFYLAAKQPWRTVSFAISLLATIALLVSDVWFTFHITERYARQSAGLPSVGSRASFCVLDNPGAIFRGAVT